MIFYLDSNALVKLFVEEPGSAEVIQATKVADRVGTVAISRVEVVAAFGKALRVGWLSRENAVAARHQFITEWRHYWHLRVSDSLIERAADLSWSYQLRGYDSVQLAAAMAWQEILGVPVSLITFDLRLWEAAKRVGLDAFPQDLLRLCESWKDLS
jgi:predicted nucleic acid-binding protein